MAGKRLERSPDYSSRPPTPLPSPPLRRPAAAHSESAPWASRPSGFPLAIWVVSVSQCPLTTNSNLSQLCPSVLPASPSTRRSEAITYFPTTGTQESQGPKEPSNSQDPSWARAKRSNESQKFATRSEIKGGFGTSFTQLQSGLHPPNFTIFEIPSLGQTDLSLRGVLSVARAAKRDSTSQTAHHRPSQQRLFRLAFLAWVRGRSPLKSSARPSSLAPLAGLFFFFPSQNFNPSPDHLWKPQHQSIKSCTKWSPLSCRQLT